MPPNVICFSRNRCTSVEVIKNEQDLIAALKKGNYSPVVFQEEKQVGARSSSA